MKRIIKSIVRLRERYEDWMNNFLQNFDRMLQ